jgi:tRNA pseudouridine32 synthase / 23S rRNA pseudouridine746 synthase
MKPISCTHAASGSKKRRRPPTGLLHPSRLLTSCSRSRACSLLTLLLLFQQQQQQHVGLGLGLVGAHALSAPCQTTHAVSMQDAVQVRLDRLPATVAPVSKRKVALRQVEWSNSLLPLQHYHGYRLPQQSPPPPKRLDAKHRATLPLSPDQLHILYRDASIAVVHKPSGVLSVPGPRRNPNMATLLHDALGLDHLHPVDKMVVHRLDMDTSGIVVYALNEHALRTLHEDFRERRVQKRYQALVCGHVLATEGELDVALERDPHHVPFMRVATGLVDKDAVPAGAVKLLSVAPKPSFTSFRVLSRHYCGTLPVTRLELTPYTGRTHQLRVHCAAMGHAIVGDDIYGCGGDGCAGGMAAAAAADATAQAHMELGLPLCLHAERLCLHHPVTKAPMMFSADANF